MKKPTSEQRAKWNMTYSKKHDKSIKIKRRKNTGKYTNNLPEIKEAIELNNKNGLLFYKSFFGRKLLKQKMII